MTEQDLRRMLFLLDEEIPSSLKRIQENKRAMELYYKSIKVT